MGSGSASLVLLWLVLEALGGLGRHCPVDWTPISGSQQVHGRSSSLWLVHWQWCQYLLALPLPFGVFLALPDPSVPRATAPPSPSL